MKKRVLASVMAATMAAASLAGCGGCKPAETTAQAADSVKTEETTQEAKQAASGEATYNWKLGSVDSVSNPNYKAFEHLNELLNEKAPGKWNITIYPDSQLGDGAQQVESVQMGTLELAAPNCSAYHHPASDLTSTGKISFSR